jgi:phosphatidylglycerol:prolipoprotein diacylglycerol transferase
MTYLHQIDPIALQLGPLGIHWYGLTYLVAFAAAYGLGMRRLAQGRLAVSKDAFGDLMFYGMLGVILGGRLGYMLVYGSAQWREDPMAILRVWEGGMSFHGGFLGVLLSSWIWVRRQGVRFWDVVDFLAPLVPTGIFSVRVGNFIGGELYGKPTGSEWGVVFPRSLTEQPWASMSPDALRAAFDAGQLTPFLRHPTQLYEAFLEGVVLFVVLWWFTARPRPRYAASGVFALLYGSFRIAVEFLRVPDEQMGQAGYLAFGWLTTGMVLSLPMVVVGLVFLGLSMRVGAVAGTGRSTAPGDADW